MIQAKSWSRTGNVRDGHRSFTFGRATGRTQKISSLGHDLFPAADWKTGDVYTFIFPQETSLKEPVQQRNQKYTSAAASLSAQPAVRFSLLAARLCEGGSSSAATWRGAAPDSSENQSTPIFSSFAYAFPSPPRAWTLMKVAKTEGREAVLPTDPQHDLPRWLLWHLLT